MMIGPRPRRSRRRRQVSKPSKSGQHHVEDDTSNSRRRAPSDARPRRCSRRRRRCPRPAVRARIAAAIRSSSSTIRTRMSPDCHLNRDPDETNLKWVPQEYSRGRNALHRGWVPVTRKLRCGGITPQPPGDSRAGCFWHAEGTGPAWRPEGRDGGRGARARAAARPTRLTALALGLLVLITLGGWIGARQILLARAGRRRHRGAQALADHDPRRPAHARGEGHRPRDRPLRRPTGSRAGELAAQAGRDVEPDIATRAPPAPGPSLAPGRSR